MARNRIILPGGSYVDVEENGQDPDEVRQQRADREAQRRQDSLVRSLQAELADPDRFADDMVRNVDETVAKFVDPRRPDDPVAEMRAESAARQSITRSLEKKMSEAAEDEPIAGIFGRPIG